MSNNTDVDDSPKDASDTADEERPERQGDQSPLEEDGDRRPDVDDPIDEFESSSDQEE
jgi:Lon-like ATP-dependent protease